MTTLYPYQRKGVQIIERHKGRVLLADEMGLGKTIQALTYLKNHRSVLPALVITPASLKYLWKSQARQHIKLNATILNGKKVPPRNPLLNIKSRIVIINYDILDAWMEYLIEYQPQSLIIDECHYVKNGKAIRTKRVRSLARKIPHMIAISGTPLTNRPIELFQTINMLWKKDFPSWWHYAFRYCDPTRNFWGWDFSGSSNLPELHERLKSLGMIRRIKKQVLTDLPSKVRRVVPLPHENYKEYQQIENNFLDWLRKKKPEKVEKARQAARLVQLGYLKRHAAAGKMKGVLEWVDNYLEETDGKLVLFAIHKTIIAQLHQTYPKLSLVLDGSVPSNKRHLIINEFQKSKHRRIFIGQLKAAGVGIDLFAADTLAFIELDWVITSKPKIVCTA
jgi:SWI/SNF-related matrix-associated actin-dependent regulator 1 of chromatin subfamily A